MRKKLVISDGTRERELQLVGRIVVGRDPSCEISHDDSLLSRRHAEFLTSGDTVTVRDLGSRNGVFVNGARAAEQALNAGDIIQIGPLRARYIVDHAAAGIAPEELDFERTRVIHRRAPAATAASGPPPAAAARVAEAEDEDVTRMVPAPRLRHAGAVAAASSPDADDDRTQFISARSDLMRPVPGAVAAADAVTAAMTMPADPVERVTPAVERPLSSLVFVPLLALAGIVLAAATLPSLMWRRALLNNAVADSASISLLWLALPVAVALIATYVVTILITRRFSSALSAVERDRT